MRNHNPDNLQSVFSNEDLSHLLQRGRSLHDHAVYDLLCAFVKRGRLLLKNSNTLSTRQKSKISVSSSVPLR